MSAPGALRRLRHLRPPNGCLCGAGASPTFAQTRRDRVFSEFWIAIHDSSAPTYNRADAKEAWNRSITWLRQAGVDRQGSHHDARRRIKPRTDACTYTSSELEASEPGSRPQANESPRRRRSFCHRVPPALHCGILISLNMTRQLSWPRPSFLAATRCRDRNAAERGLRGIALGRKSWLFAGSDRGGQRAAMMYSLIVTAKMNDVDPQAWLADVLRRIADHPASRLHELLPWRWSHDRKALAA